MQKERHNLSRNILFLAIWPTTLAIYTISKYGSMVPSKMAGYDSSVFATMGFSWLHGSIPYKDLFDHKGPLLYLINLLGFYLFNDFFGIAIIEIFTLSILFYTILILCRENILTGIALLAYIVFCFFKNYFDGGNLTEEYALTPSIIALFAFEKQASSRFMLYGTTGAATFLLRPNLAIAPLFFFILDLTRTRKPYISTLSCAFCFALATSTAFAYFSYHDALQNLLQHYFVFNKSYIQDAHADILGSAISLFVKMPAFIAITTCYTILVYRKSKTQAMECMFFVFTSLLCSTMSGKPYPHYAMTMLPAFLFLHIRASQLYKPDNYINQAYQFAKLKLNSRPLLATTLKPTAICNLAFAITFSFTLAHTAKAFDFSKLQQARSFLAAQNINQATKIINLSDHEATKIFFLARSAPREADFFPVIIRQSQSLDCVQQDLTDYAANHGYDVVITHQNATCIDETIYKLTPNPLFKSKLYVKR